MKHTIKIEVRSSINDNVVATIEKDAKDVKNPITEGWNHICNTLKINRVDAERRYYINA